MPRIYFQHDPPWEAPADERHWVDDPEMLLVHCTHFNAMMFDNGRTPTKVIEHGVTVPEQARYTGEINRGVVMVNHLKQRGRKVGADIFQTVRGDVPLDLVGMAAEELGGLDEVSPPMLAEFAAHYRFFFNPIRYTSLGLAVLEAMMIGLPIVGVAGCEIVTVIRNGENGFLETDPQKLIPHMQRLIANPNEARSLGEVARKYALERFNIQRLARDWEQTIWEVAGDSIARPTTPKETVHELAKHVVGRLTAGCHCWLVQQWKPGTRFALPGKPAVAHQERENKYDAEAHRLDQRTRVSHCTARQRG